MSQLAFILVVLFQVNSYAYVPYELKSEPQYQHAPLPLANPPQTTSFDLRNARLNFESSLAKLMLRISAGPHAWSQASNQNLFDCSRILNFASELTSSTDQDLQKALSAVAQSCAILAKPELLFAKSRVVEPSFFGFSDVEDALELLITGLLLQNLPLSFFDEGETLALKAALLKLKYSDVKSNLNSTKNLLQRSLQTNSLLPHEKSTLERLAGTFDQVFAQVMDLNAKSKQRYVQDAQAVQASGRSRSQLPYDNLTDADRRILTIYLSGHFWRLRGGGLVDKPSGTQATRYHYTQVVMNLLSDLNAGSDAIRHGDDHFSNLIFEKGWGPWMDMGRNPNQASEAHDLLYMTRRGADQVGSLVGKMNSSGFDTDPIEISGIQMGICYLFAWEKLTDLKLSPQVNKPFAPFMDGPTAWGEWCFGTSLGKGLSDSFLKGRR